MTRNTSLNRGMLIAGLAISLAGISGEQAAHARNHKALRGMVSVMGEPVSNASVTLWQTHGGATPKRIKTLRSNNDGSFDVVVQPKD